MLYLVITCYFFCFYLASRRKLYILCCFLPVYTCLFLYVSFSDYFINKDNDSVDINFWLFFICLFYFLFELILFYFSYNKIIYILLCCLFITALPYTGLIIPLNILILLYPEIYFLLPKFDSSFLNLFFLYFIPVLFFYKLNFFRKFLTITFLIVCFFVQGTPQSNEKLKIAIIQVGLYYKKGGDENRFFNDLSAFLKKHNDVDLVVFSENTFYGYKNKYSINRTDGLLFDIENSGALDNHAFLINLYGYNDLNNVVSVFRTKDDMVINQKEILIPFIEKEGVFNKKNSFKSKFLTVDDKHKNKKIIVGNLSIGTYICYEALFPKFFDEKFNLTLIQSDYNQLNKGNKYSRVLNNGAILSKFSNGMNSSFLVNVQNIGGTILIDNKWNVDNKIYHESEINPFLIINVN